jgi:hypothetical protein
MVTLLLLLSLMQQPADVNTGTLRSSLTDMTGKAIAGRLVVYADPKRIRRQPVAIDTVVNVENGKASVSLPEGLYDVYVSAPGLHPVCSTILIVSGRTWVYDVRLGMTSSGVSQSQLDPTGQ